MTTSQAGPVAAVLRPRRRRLFLAAYGSLLVSGLGIGWLLGATDPP
jgi:hypothetical protein